MKMSQIFFALSDIDFLLFHDLDNFNFNWKGEMKMSKKIIALSDINFVLFHDLDNPSKWVKASFYCEQETLSLVLN